MSHLFGRDIAIHPPPVAPSLSFFVFIMYLFFNGADHNNSPLTGEGEVKKKKKKNNWVGV